MRHLALPFVLLPGFLALAGCSHGYSPNTYASNAAQVAANVQRGVIIGVRQVMISANGTIGTVTGGAAGGVAGSQIGGGPVGTALGAIGGTLVGGLGGAAASEVVADTKGWEYIVQETGGKLVSVTQTSKEALSTGLHVLVIAGAQQARIVPDYTVQDVVKPPQPKANGAAATEINISPLPPEVGVAAPVQMPAFGVEGDAVIAPPVVPPSAAGGSAPPGVVNKGSLATEPGSTGASTAPVQGATSEPIVTPPASGAAATTH